ncbi:MAG: hypothetical protein K8R35_09985 [Bacteroidales bacterium]|nr:hypothetical protein [Bacteroidales bacterium]
MISKKEHLINRGYLIEGGESKYLHMLFDEKIKLLQSKIPTERTLGARLVADSKENRTIEYLIKALMLEKKLYSRIEICNSLISFGQLCIKPLIAILGKAGTNQHKSVPEKEFKKDSYPLPRDIAARTLIRIGKNALPELVKVLESGNEKQLSEAIDAIGFICFYDYKSGIYAKLKECYTQNGKNDLIRWKIIRAMSGFSESELFLQEQKRKILNKRLQKEIERSLSLIKK